MIQRSPLRKGVDFYIENGCVVLTRAYHLKRGHCCGSKCRHCPYDGLRGSKKTKKESIT